MFGSIDLTVVSFNGTRRWKLKADLRGELFYG